MAATKTPQPRQIEHELRFYFSNPSVLEAMKFERSGGSNTDIMNMIPKGIEMSRTRAGWLLRYPSGWTEDHRKIIGAAIALLDPFDQIVLREFNSMHPPARIGKGERWGEYFDVWSSIVHLTPSVCDATEGLDDTSKRLWVRDLIDSIPTAKGEAKKEKQALARRIRAEARTMYVQARDAYEQARKDVRAALKARRKGELH